jgi:iron complex transport system substrate-binding protein
VYRSAFAFFVALAAALVAVSLSAAAPQQTSKTHTYRRIVSLSPTLTEDLFAIGAGKQVIAVDQDSNYPKSAPRTKLSGINPNVEAVAKYHPDLVVVSYGGKYVHQLKQLGIKVVDEPAVVAVSGEFQEIEKLGALTGHTARAGALVQSIKRKLRAIVNSVPASRRHLRIYHEIDPTYYSATSKTFIGSIYALFGFRDIADKADKEHTGYPQLSAEYILKENPQIIVLADGKTPAQVAKRPGWSAIAALKDHRVVTVNEDIASRGGPRIVEFAQDVARIAKTG